MEQKKQEALLIGAIAGASPLIVNLVNVDAGLIFDSFEWKIFMGYLIKAIVLMFLGTFLVYVNSEIDKWKAFQIGIMAPAVIISAINANTLAGTQEALTVAQKQIQELTQSNTETDIQGSNSSTNNQVGFKSFFIISQAYAQQETNLRKGLHREPGTFQQIWYGVTGNISNPWFVIVGSHETEKVAESQVKKLSELGYEARVYPPFRGSEYYGVVIGSYLKLYEAKRLKQQALKDGLPKDTYLWKYKP
ncbi:MAG: SPOR domain-containing protein [Thermodesulfobacteriota bacterium]